MTEYFTFVHENIESIPEDGWLQQCITCDNITSITKRIYTHNIFLCGKCDKKYTKLILLSYINKNKNLFKRLKL